VLQALLTATERTAVLAAVASVILCVNVIDAVAIVTAEGAALRLRSCTLSPGLYAQRKGPTVAHHVHFCVLAHKGLLLHVLQLT
jgi:hypothetical protein